MARQPCCRAAIIEEIVHGRGSAQRGGLRMELQLPSMHMCTRRPSRSVGQRWEERVWSFAGQHNDQGAQTVSAHLDGRGFSSATSEVERVHDRLGRWRARDLSRARPHTPA